MEVRALSGAPGFALRATPGAAIFLMNLIKIKIKSVRGECFSDKKNVSNHSNKSALPTLFDKVIIMNKKSIYFSLFFAFLTLGSYCWFSNPFAQKKRPIRVYADMVADMFHPGHVEFFKKAKKFGDILIIGLVSDEDAAPYKRKPIMTLDERKRAVEACKYVDEVIPGSPMVTTKEFMEKHNIDIVVHGDDYTQAQLKTYYSDPMEMGKYHSVSYTPGISTSNLINRIKERFA